MATKAKASTFTATYKHETYTLVLGKDGRYRLTEPLILAEQHPDGFTSLSGAGAAVCGKPTSGRRFWGAPAREHGAKAEPIGYGTAAAAKAKAESKPAKTKERAPRPLSHRKLFRLIMTTEDGTVDRYICGACLKPFDVLTGVKPTECPEGHTQALATAAEQEASYTVVSDEDLDREAAAGITPDTQWRAADVVDEGAVVIWEEAMA